MRKQAGVAAAACTMGIVLLFGIMFYCRAAGIEVKLREDWEEKVSTWDKHSEVVIRAEVMIPAEADKTRISEEKALSYVEILIGDRTLYHSLGTTIYTADHIDNEIDFLQYHVDTNLENWEWRFVDAPVVDFPLIKKKRMQATKERISLLKYWRRTAPDTRYHTRALMRFHDVEAAEQLQMLEREHSGLDEKAMTPEYKAVYAMKCQEYTQKLEESMGQSGAIEGITDMGEGWEAYVRITPGSLQYRRYWRQDLEGYPQIDEFRGVMYREELTISQQEAEQWVMELLDQMKILHMKIDTVKKEENQYIFKLAPSWKYIDRKARMTIQEAGESADGMTVTVDQRGICGVKWNCGSAVPDSVQGIQDLLGFERIQRQARKELVQLARSHGAEEVEKSLEVTKVVMKFRDLGDGSCFPVWEFIGDCRTVDAQGNKEKHKDQLLLTLDAVTGDVIP